jgi:Flp pilus assembly protein TadD
LNFTPNDSYAWIKIGSSLDNLGKFEEAIWAYDQALKIDPEFELAWFILNRQ